MILQGNRGYYALRSARESGRLALSASPELNGSVLPTLVTRDCVRSVRLCLRLPLSTMSPPVALTSICSQIQCG